MLRYWEKKPLHLKRSAPKYYEAWVRVRKSMKHPEADEKPESEFSWFSYVFIRCHGATGNFNISTFFLLG